MRKILVANRGEIAVRVMRTCREMGISTVGIYSEADSLAVHTRFADEAVCVGPAAVSESYLNIERVLEAARRTGADAIHPGYGFLSENAVFARRCEEAGFCFVGPSPQCIKKMGEKISAKALMKKAGVPTVPGYEGAETDVTKLAVKAKEIGFPVLIKASAGGGGKGMRLVRKEGELGPALEGARREAERAFGNGALLLEKYLESARHVEVQIFGDKLGNVIHLNERDCSLQRRHQKILEESPSPAVGPELRERLCAAAVLAGKAIGYDNAGTVEFMLDSTGNFYFLEMNTRLQVEHPVTEMVTGLDLVRLQIEVAEGRQLSLKQIDIPLRGHAVEVRLYAEEPANHFAPATGTIVRWEIPDPVLGVRIDSGIKSGDRVGIEYDPMLAKIIAHGSSRLEAIGKLEGALRGLVLQGFSTNREFLLRLLNDEGVRRGEFSTSYVESKMAAWLPTLESRIEIEASVVALIYWHLQSQSTRAMLPGIPTGFRNNPFRYPSAEWQGSDEKPFSLSYSIGAEKTIHVIGNGSEWVGRVIHAEPGALRLELNGLQRRYQITQQGDLFHVSWGDTAFTVKRCPRFPERGSALASGGVRAPMTGRVTRVMASEGQKVNVGDPLLVLEAMKMEQTVHAVQNGMLAEILVKEGDTVEMGLPLIKMGDSERL